MRHKTDYIAALAHSAYQIISSDVYIGYSNVVRLYNEQHGNVNPATGHLSTTPELLRSIPPRIYGGLRRCWYFDYVDSTNMMNE
jgi:hypothetical protein